MYHQNINPEVFYPIGVMPYVTPSYGTPSYGNPNILPDYSIPQAGVQSADTLESGNYQMPQGKTSRKRNKGKQGNKKSGNNIKETIKQQTNDSSKIFIEESDGQQSKNGNIHLHTAEMIIPKNNRDGINYRDKKKIIEEIKLNYLQVDAVIYKESLHKNIAMEGLFQQMQMTRECTSSMILLMYYLLSLNIEKENDMFDYMKNVDVKMKYIDRPYKHITIYSNINAMEEIYRQIKTKMESSDDTSNKIYWTITEPSMTSIICDLKGIAKIVELISDCTSDDFSKLINH